LDKIEDKAMKSFSTSIEVDRGDEVDDIDLDSIVAKQMADWKTKFGSHYVNYASKASASPNNICFPEKLNEDCKLSEEKKNELLEELQSLKTQFANKSAIQQDPRVEDDKDKQIAELKNEIRKLTEDLQSFRNLTDNEKLTFKEELRMKTIELEATKELVNAQKTHENELNESLAEKKTIIDKLKKNVEQHEVAIETLKKNNQLLKTDELNSLEKLGKLNDALTACQNELKDKLKGIGAWVACQTSSSCAY
jgi:chromosome segregation ATPase